MKQFNSENIDLLFTALSKAQGQFKNASKDTVNTFFKSKYADLSSTWNACKDALSSNGLSIIQCTDTDVEGKLVLVTTLGHSSGQWMRSYMPVIAQKQDAQSMGSAISYARRYSLGGILSIVTSEDDDDGQAAGQVKYIDQRQVEELSNLFSKCDAEFVNRVWKSLRKQGFDSYQKISTDIFERVKESCVQNIKENSEKDLKVENEESKN